MRQDSRQPESDDLSSNRSKCEPDHLLLDSVIQVDRDKCISCHACIAVCPTKFGNDGRGESVNLNPNFCIGCGQCLTACTHQARRWVDDFIQFLDYLTKGGKAIAIVAPSVAANFPQQYLHLNGWLKHIGLSAVFDISFGAELTAKSYVEYLKTNANNTVIAQPCPAVVTYIEAFQPELLPYLAPVDSPMLHTIKMIRRYYPQYHDHKVVVISPCLAKKREFSASGQDVFSIGYRSLLEHFEANNIDLGALPCVDYDNPPADIAVAFSSPGGLVKTLERYLPGITLRTRRVEGVPAIYDYLKQLPDVIADGKGPLLLDCLNCSMGCNGGPMSLNYDKSIENNEYWIEQRLAAKQTSDHSAMKGGLSSKGSRIETVLEQYWSPDLYVRSYVDRRERVALRQPNRDELDMIFRSMHKYSQQDQYNCTACGYNSCQKMATAIFNDLNKPENCHFYLARENQRRQDALLEAQRRQSEQSQRENEIMLFRIIQGLPHPTFIIGRDHKIIHWNRALEELTGLSADDFVGTNQHWKAFYSHERPCMVDLIVDEQFDQLSQWYTKEFKQSALIKEGYEGTDFFPDLPKGGRWIHFTAAAIRDSKGELVAALEMLEDVTEKTEAEDALRESERRLSALMDNLPGMSYRCRNEKAWPMEFVSEGALSVTGYRPEELVGNGALSYNDLIFPEDRERLWKQWQDVLSAKEKFAEEYRIITKDGQVRWVWEQGQGVYSETGEIFALEGFITDITERKQAQEALADEMTRRRILFERSPDGIVVLDESGKVYEANERYAQMLGYSMEEVRQLHVWDWDAQWTREQLHQRVKDLKITGNHFETRHRRKDGTVYDVEISSNVGICGGQKLVFCVCRDISDRKQAEEALIESEKRFRTLFENTPSIAVQGYDRHRNVIFWNRASEELYGYSASEAFGRKLEDLIIPEQMRSDVIAGVESWVNGGPAIPASEVTLQRADGTAVDIFSSHLLLQNIRGEIEMYCIDIDLSARKQAEQKLQVALAEAETLNRYLEEQTAYANQLASQAEAANAAKSQFLANMSHEIRTPMNGVIGMTGLLLDTELTGEQREFAGIIKSCGESLLALINDILDYSKISAGKLDLEALDFDIRDVLEDFAGTMAIRAHQKRLEFICAANPDVPSFLKGDPGRLRQILTNLVGNAIKFTEQGEVVVRVEADTQTDTEVVLRFTIRDTGIGIPAEKINLLFEKFMQVDASTTRKYGGSGLGLAISKQLAEIMDGQIGVSSVEGEGSTFWFTVRLALQPECDRPRTQPAEIFGKRILVVDDNATNRQILSLRLSSWGAMVSEAPDGPTALAIMNQALSDRTAFDVVITDMQMPEMDGLMLADAIRQDERFGRCCLVMMTSLGQPVDAKELAAIGFSACLTKPVRSSELFTRLKTALTGKTVDMKMTQEAKTNAEALLDASTVRILLAEDNITNQQVALSILSRMGLRADAVADGLEAVKALEDIPYDLVLMDVQMPEMDGLKATQVIRDPRSAVRNHNVPVIAMTAHAMQGDRERCLEAGMNDYISKPVAPQALAELLAQWLGQQPCPAASEPEADLPEPNSSDQAELPVYDRAGFLDRLAGDVDMAKTVIAIFLCDIPNQIDSLKASIQTADTQHVEYIAHTIKGAAASVGGQALCDVADQIEQACKTDNATLVDRLSSELEVQFSRLKDAIKHPEVP